MTLPERCCCVCVIFLFFVACNGKTWTLVDDPANKQGQKVDESPASKPKETLSYLDLQHPKLVQAIGSEDGKLEECKFVQVEVASVVNPKSYPVSVEVSYQPKADKEIYLGSFSLFPADNPGKFIVATQHRLKSEGSILLSLVVQAKVGPDDKVELEVKRIKFIK